MALVLVTAQLAVLMRGCRSPSLTASSGGHLTKEIFLAASRDPRLLQQEAIARAFLPTPWLLPPLPSEGGGSRGGGGGSRGEGGSKWGPDGGDTSSGGGGGSSHSVGRRRALLAPPNFRGLENDLDGLLQARSQPVGTYSKAISVVHFNHHHTLMLQNWIYSAVKWAGIENYIVATWDDESLRVCLDLNLPCYNATSYLPLPTTTAGESRFYRGDFIAITWLKPLLARELVSRGYLVHVCDVDVAFPPKAFWPSVLRFLEPAGADVAMERDYFGPINCGSMVILPSPRTLSWLHAWLANMSREARAKRSSQRVLGDQARARLFLTCDGPWDCQRLRRVSDTAVAAMAAKARQQQQQGGWQWARQQGRRPAAQQAQQQQVDRFGKRPGELVLVRRYLSAYEGVFQDHCAGKWLEWAMPVDPCIPSTLHYHVVCANGLGNKTLGLKATGMWFLDDEATANCTQLPADLAGLAELAGPADLAGPAGEGGPGLGQGVEGIPGEEGVLGAERQAAAWEEQEGGSRGEAARGGGSQTGGGLPGGQRVLQDVGTEGSRQSVGAFAATAALAAVQAARQAVTAQRGQAGGGGVAGQLQEAAAALAAVSSAAAAAAAGQDKALAGATTTDDDSSDVTPRCVPLWWREPKYENPFLRLQETKVAPAGESDTEHNQTEVLAVLAGDVVGLDALPTLNVQSWLSSPDTGPDVDPFFDDVDSRAAAVLVLRLLQAYQQETGQEFDDEDNACFEELDAIASQALKGSVDRDLLRRLVRAYITLPFGGLV
ncbi:hypothetical protein N2152v2_010144 [Parachlorella kessleri]